MSYRLLAAVAVAAIGFQAEAASCVTGALEPAALEAKGKRIDRFYFHGGVGPYRALSGLGDPEFDEATDSLPFEAWRATDAQRALLVRMAPESPSSEDFGTCRLEAPLAILEARIAALGEDHPYVRHWTEVQKAVFSACQFYRQAKPLPGPLGGLSPQLARLQAYDRAYQTASASFYRGETDAALAAFDRIAADRNSPNRPYGAYMAVAIRAGSRHNNFGDIVPLAPVGETRAQIGRILADPSLGAVHAMAANLLGWIAYNTHDAEAQAGQTELALSALKTPLAQLKSSPAAKARYVAAQSNWTMTGMRRAAVAGDPLAAWLTAPETPYSEHYWAIDLVRTPEERAALIDARRRLKADPNGPWKVKAETAPDSWTVVQDEIDRAARCDDQAAMAALPFDFYYSVRKSMTAKGPRRAQERARALDRLAAFPFKSSDVFGVTVRDALTYLIDDGDLATARLLRDRLGLDLHRQPVWMDQPLMVLAENEERLARIVARFNAPATQLNPLSIAALWSLADRPEIGLGQRALLARTAWTRSYALGRVIDGRHDELMRRLNPELVKAWRSPAGQPVRPTDRKVLADVLASPGLNLVIASVSRMPPASGRGDARRLIELDTYNSNDNNWWCGWETTRQDRAMRQELISAMFYSADLIATRGGPGEAELMARLSRARSSSFLFRNIDRAELAALAKAGPAPKLLAQRTIDWVRHAEQGQDGQLQAEALADAVRVTRWSCNRQGGYAVYSRAAYTLLHDRFPQSDAAKRTKYWFDKLVR